MAEPSEGELASLLRRVTDLLERLSIPYHLTGGIVSSYYGDPRFTQDIDIVVHLFPEQIDGLIDQLKDKYYISPESIEEAIRGKGLFQVLDNDTYIKIDFHVGEAIPGELSRSNEVRLFKDVTARICSIEDALVSKLRWIKLGSHRSRDDVIGMLHGEYPIDFELVRKLSQELSVEQLLEEFLSETSRK